MIMLVSASFVGCIEDSTEDTLIEDNTVDETTQEEDTNDQDVNDSEEVSEEDELITPVGNSTNMAPYVDAGTWNDDQWGEHIIYDGDYDDHDDYDNTSFSVFVHEKYILATAFGDYVVCLCVSLFVFLQEMYFGNAFWRFVRMSHCFSLCFFVSLFAHQEA